MAAVDVPQFADLPDRSTPLTAAKMNEWGAAIKANAAAAEGAAATAATDAAAAVAPIVAPMVTAAEAARDEAVAHVEILAAPSDAQVAGYVAGIGGPATRAALDSAFVSGDRSKDAPGFGLFFPEAHGAIPGDPGDSTASIQAAMAAAAAAGGGTVHFIRDTFNVTSLTPVAGVRLAGNGATLVGTSAAAEGIIATAMGAGTDDFDVDDFVFDCDGVVRRAVFARGARIRIRRNVIKGLTNPAVSVGGIRLYYSSTDCEVSGNHITLGTDVPFGTFPSLIGIMVTGQATSTFAGLDVADDVGVATNLCTDITVRDNTVLNGTHGVALMAAEDCRVSGNRLIGQTHRSILLSPQASRNDVFDNRCENFGSAAVHIAYGSDGNFVHNNAIFSDGSLMIAPTGGEGAIQVYVHCHDNRIQDNRIRTKSVKYGVYVAIYCNGTAVEGNDIEWTRRACIAVESDWSASPGGTEKFARPNYGPPPNTAWSSWDNGKGLSQVSIRNNRLRRSVVGTAAAGIYVSQTLAANLSSLTVEGNLIDSQDNAAEDVYVYVADAAKLTESSIDRNRTTPTEVLHTVFTNASTTLVSYRDNNWQSRVWSIPAGTTSIDWSKTDYRALAAADTISAFTGTLAHTNYPGRLLTLRLFAGATIVHSAAIWLRDSANVTATSNTQFVTFRAMSPTSAFEVSRNF